jgi:hypothetical protein
MMPSTTPPWDAGTCTMASAMKTGKPMIVQMPASTNSSHDARGGIGRRKMSSSARPVHPAIAARAAERKNGSKATTASRVNGSVPPNKRTPASPSAIPNRSREVVMREADASR